MTTPDTTQSTAWEEECRRLREAAARLLGAPPAAMPAEWVDNLGAVVADLRGQLEAREGEARQLAAERDRLTDRLSEIHNTIGETLPLSVQHRGPIDADT